MSNEGDKVAIVVIVAISVLAMIILAYSLTSSSFFGEREKKTPRAAYNVAQVDNRTWTVKVLTIAPSVSIASASYSLEAPDGTVVKEGTVQDIYGFNLGYSQGVVFADNDFNGKVSPKDVHPECGRGGRSRHGEPDRP